MLIIHVAKKRRIEPNEIIKNESYAEITLYDNNIPFCKTSIDLEDIDKVKNCVWRLNAGGYVEGYINKKRTLLHRYLIKASADREVDHINDHLYGDKKLDNRKSNLRECSRSENMMNRNRNKNKRTSIYKDVFENDVSHYRVVISGKNYGTYSNEDAAANAYNYYVSDLHGEFAHYMEVRFMKKEEWMKYRRYSTSSVSSTSSSNTSGYTGLRFSKNRWQVSVCFEGKEFFVGRFKDKDKALEIRRQAEKIKRDNIDNIEEGKKLIKKLNEHKTKSGIKGVTWDNSSGKWRVRIQRDKKRIQLGEYANLDEAIKVRQNAEEKDK